MVAGAALTGASLNVSSNHNNYQHQQQQQHGHQQRSSCNSSCNSSSILNISNVHSNHAKSGGTVLVTGTVTAGSNGDIINKYGKTSARDVVVQPLPHSINSYQQTDPHPAHLQQLQHIQTVSSSNSNSSLPLGGYSRMQQCVPHLGSNGICARDGDLAASMVSSCDKRVYVEKRIKTNDSESTGTLLAGGGSGGGGDGHQSEGFKAIDVDKSV